MKENKTNKTNKTFGIRMFKLKNDVKRNHGSKLRYVVW